MHKFTLFLHKINTLLFEMKKGENTFYAKFPVVVNSKPTTSIKERVES